MIAYYGYGYEPANILLCYDHMPECRGEGDGWRFRMSVDHAWIENVFGDRRFVVYTDKCAG